MQSPGAGEDFLASPDQSLTTPQPVYHPPPRAATPAVIATKEQQLQDQYAAKCSTFMERVKETLDIADIQQELTRENYKQKFHKLLCWEEKEHIDILGRRLEVMLYEDTSSTKNFSYSKSYYTHPNLIGYNEKSLY